MGRRRFHATFILYKTLGYPELGYSVKEISFILNYKSTEHFFSLFKKHTGFTPMEYRSFGRDTEPETGE